MLSVFGFKNHNCATSAKATMPPKRAKPAPSWLPSVHLPNTCVTAAPAKTPVMFMMP